MSVFNDEVLKIRLDFTSNSGRMESDAKIAAKLTAELERMMRMSLDAGQGVQDLTNDVRKLAEEIKRVEQGSKRGSQLYGVTSRVGRFLGAYTPERITAMSGPEALRRHTLVENATMKAALDNVHKQAQQVMIDAVKVGWELPRTTNVVLLDMQKMNKGELELHARLVQYDTARQQFGHRIQSLSATLDLASDAKLNEQNRLFMMIKSASIGVTRYGPASLMNLEKGLPGASSMIPWMSVTHDIPWRRLGKTKTEPGKFIGFRDTSLDEFFKATYGLSSRHAQYSSASSRVDQLQNILQSTPHAAPGHHTYMKIMLKGQVGPQTKEEKIIDQYVEEAEQLAASRLAKLGYSRRYVIKHKPEHLPIRPYDRGLITAKGPGSAQDVTPQNLGAEGTRLDQEVATLREFIQNAVVTHGDFLFQHFKDAATRQDKRSREFSNLHPGDQVITGENVLLRIFRGVNRSVDQLRPPFRQLHAPGEGTYKGEDPLAGFNKQSTQLWTQIPGIEEAMKLLRRVESFERMVDKLPPTRNNIQKAARMATMVGPGHPSYNRLGDFVLRSQGKNRLKRTYDSFDEDDLFSPTTGLRYAATSHVKLLPGVASAAPKDRTLADAGADLRAAMKEAVRKASGSLNAGPGGFLEDLFKAYQKRSAGQNGVFSILGGKLSSAFGSMNIGDKLSSFMSGAGGVFSNFAGMFGGRGGRGSGGGGGSRSMPPPPGGPPPGGGDQKAQMRLDALNAKLERLADVIQNADRALAHFNDTIAPMRRDAVMTSNAIKTGRIDDAKDRVYASVSNQRRALDFREQMLERGQARKGMDITDQAGLTATRLGLAEIDAELAVKRAKRAQEAKLKKYKLGEEYSKRLSTTDAATLELELKRETMGPVRAAQMQQAKAVFRRQMFFAKTPEETQDAKDALALRYGKINYGAGAQATELTMKVAGMLPGRSAGEIRETKKDRVKEDFDATVSTIDDKRQVLRDKIRGADKKAADDKVNLATDTARKLDKIDSDVTKKKADNDVKVTQTQRKQQEARTAYVRREADIAGRGGGGGGRGGGGGGGRGGGAGAADDFMSRGGMMWGLGAASVVAYGKALESVIADTIIYAARTETLALTTNQMAKVNGLNTRHVEDQVQSVKELNITTQEAHSTVQKMIFAQLDVAKATQLARTAQDAAIIGNINSSEALEKIILGITTGQTRLLHNMGLQVSLLQVIRDVRIKKRSEGDNTEPNELEKRAAMLNKVIKEGAKLAGTYERAMLTAGKQFNSLQREIQETQNAIGDRFLPVFGRLVSNMSSGLGFVREHADGFAHLTTILGGLSAAMASIGSMAFFNFLLKSPSIPIGVKAVGAVVGLGAYAYANQDPVTARSNTTIEQLDKINEKVKKARVERSLLWKDKDGSDDWKNSWEINTSTLESLTKNQVAIQQEFTRQLAEEYIKRNEDLDNYYAAIEGKRDIFSRIWANIAGHPGDPAKYFPKDMPAGVNIEDVVAMATSLETERKRRENTPRHIINEEQIRLRANIADMQHAQQLMYAMEDKQSSLGTAGRRALMFGESPTGKVLLEQALEKQRLTGVVKNMDRLEAESKSTDPKVAAKAKNDLYLMKMDLGDKDLILGEEKMQKFRKEFSNIIAEVDYNAGIQLKMIKQQTAVQLLSLDESTKIAKIESQAIPGSAVAEKAIAEGIFNVAVKAANARFMIRKDPEALTLEIAQAQSNKDKAEFQRQAVITGGMRDRTRMSDQSWADFQSNQVLQSPIEAEAAIRRAYEIQMDATYTMTNDQEKFNKQLELSLKLRTDLAELARQEAKLSAEGRVAFAQIGSELQSEVDRIVMGKGRSSRERNVDEIARSTARAVGLAEFSYNEMKPHTDSANQEALKQQRDIAIFQARAQGAVALVKELDQQLEAAKQRQVDHLDMQYQRMEKINELQALNAADEEAAAYNTHVYRMELIQKEYEALGETKDALADKDRKELDANFDHLQRLLQMRKNEMQAIRNVSGQVFDSLLEGKTAVKDLALSHLKATGRTVFQNIVGLGMGNARNVLGSIIPGQGRKDAQGVMHPSLLGKILGGTVFSPSNTEDIQKLLADVTKDSFLAEIELKKSIDSLDAAVRAANGLIPGYGATGAAGAAGASGAAGVAGAISGVSSLPGVSSIPGVAAAGSTGAAIARIFASTGGGAGSATSSQVANILGLPAIMGGAGPAFPLTAVNMPASFGMPASMQAQMAQTAELPDAAGKFTSNVVKGNKVPGWQQALTGFGGGALGQYNMFDVFGGKSSVRTGFGGGSATAMSGMQRAGAMAGMAATVAGGVMQSIGGFKEGGAKGIASGIGGILTAASVIPGPQQPFVMAGALMAGFVSSILKSKTEDRKKEIEEVMKNTKYIAPVEVKLEMSAEGNLLSYDKYGNPRDTGVSAFPVSLQQNAYRPSIADEDEQLFLPGQVLENTATRNGVTINYYTTVPVSTMDSRSFMDNSRMVAAALQKELRGSTDMGITLQNAVFGV